MIQVNIPGKSFLQWCHIVLQSEILDIEDIDAVDLTEIHLLFEVELKDPQQ